METVLKVLARFDELGSAGLEVTTAMAAVAAADPLDVRDLARTMAELTLTPVRVSDPSTGVLLRCDVEGRVSYPDTPAAPRWISAPVLAGEPPALWLEKTGGPGIIEAVVLDSAAEILRTLRFSAPPSDTVNSHDDLAVLLTVEDPVALEGVLKRLSLTPETRCRAIARPGSRAQVHAVSPRTDRFDEAYRFTHRGSEDAPSRIGIGCLERADQLHRSWETAQTALAFAAEGTEEDPGPMVVQYDDLGLWAQLHTELPRHAERMPDLDLLETVVNGLPWAAVTLDALVTHSSVRLAAAALYTHHSTVQTRLTALEKKLGWNLNSPQGKARLSMALTARRYLRHPPESDRPRSIAPALTFAGD